MNLVHFYSDSISELNSSYHRGCIFIDAMNKIGHKGVLLHIEEWMADHRKETIAQADIIVVERLLVEQAVERSATWHNLGKPIVIDIDDSYSLLEREEVSLNQAARFWNRGLVDIHYGPLKFEKKLAVSPLEQFREGLKHVSGLTTPSRILCEDWRMYCKTWLIPNYIDANRYLPFKKNYTGVPKELTVGWGGSMSHAISFSRSGVSLALRRIFQKYKHVKFLLAGDKRILDIVKLPPDRVIFQPYVPYWEWPAILSRTQIGLAPLQGRYDSSRSTIKANEYSILGIPFVATGCPTYELHEKAGIGLYVQDSEAYDQSTIDARSRIWEDRLVDLIENYDLHKKKMDSQFELAMEWSIERRIPDVIRTYESIIANG
jgi:hypothetical protein